MRKPRRSQRKKLIEDIMADVTPLQRMAIQELRQRGFRILRDFNPWESAEMLDEMNTAFRERKLYEFLEGRAA